MTKIRIGVAGACGRMGRMLIETIGASDRAILGAATELPGHAAVGTSLADSDGALTVSSDAGAAMADCDAFIDFTSPAASVHNASLASSAGCAIVIGTTGFDAAQNDAISLAAKRTAVVKAGNMSLGINLLAQMTRKIAAALDTDFDIEVVEAHHRHKIDAPSGTALMLGSAAADGRGVSIDDVGERVRDGICGPRISGNIGFSAVRGGDIVGEHDVVFAGQGERIILRHIATDRSIYAVGALKAAIWARKQPAGLYDMCDVLEL